MNLLKKRILWAAVAGVLTAPAAAQDVYLVARPFTQTMPDGAMIVSWGYAQDMDGDFTTTADQGPVTSPGPQIATAPDDPSLTIHLRNELAVATSLMIPGQSATMTPVFFTDAQGRRRAQSFTHETAPGTEGIYTWPALRPGTYAYQSGTHPQVQVQMGLYGAAVKNAALGEAYAGVPYDAEAMLFYSEIDPALHAAVTNGTYGTPVYPSTIHYKPLYFLVNGKPYSATDAPIPAGSRGGRTLLRFINMGLRTHTPLLQDADMALVAEDGNPYPHAQRQYSVMLAAGKTSDAVFTPTAERIHAIYDRMLNPGMLSYLTVANSNAPEAAGDSYSVAEDGTLIVIAPGVLSNDLPADGSLTAMLLDDAKHGTLTLLADGSFDYLPTSDFSGIDSFSYQASNGMLQSNVATVAITVTPTNDPPVGAADHAVTQEDVPVTIDVLANDTDPDGDALFVTAVTMPTGGTLVVNSDNTVTYTPAMGTVSDSFTYVPSDGTLTGAAVTVTLDVQPAVNEAPVAVDDSVEARRNTAQTIAVLANDLDADGNIDPASVNVTVPPNMGGTYVINADGTVSYTPRLNFRGTDTFAYTVSDTAGTVSNQATVRVNVR